MNVTYEAEINTRLLIGDVILYGQKLPTESRR